MCRYIGQDSNLQSQIIQKYVSLVHRKQRRYYEDSTFPAEGILKNLSCKISFELDDTFNSFEDLHVYRQSPASRSNETIEQSSGSQRISDKIFEFLGTRKPVKVLSWLYISCISFTGSKMMRF